MQAGFARKYAIMEELDGGFSAGSTPEAFVRLDCWDGRIQVSIHVKGLKQGPYKYMLYLIFAKNDRLVPILAGTVNTSYNGMQSGLEIDADTLKNLNIKPDTIKFAALTAESQNKKWIPLFSSFEKNEKWDESVRQIILTRPVEEPSKELLKEDVKFLGNTAPQNQFQQVKTEEKSDIQALRANDTTPEGSVVSNNDQTPVVDSFMNPTPPKQQVRAPVNQGTRSVNREKSSFRCDITKLEGFLANNFEVCEPFKRSSKGYSWYRVSDLAKLSNIMYMSGINVPLFANPKILVGLFKFKHILAGLYCGDNGSQYYVIGVPAKDEKDNKPFENACRWVPVKESPVRDMGGYWLVYVSLKSGEIVV